MILYRQGEFTFSDVLKTSSRIYTQSPIEQTRSGSSLEKEALILNQQSINWQDELPMHASIGCLCPRRNIITVNKIFRKYKQLSIALQRYLGHATSLNDFRQSSISADTQQTPFEETRKDKKRLKCSAKLPFIICSHYNIMLLRLDETRSLAPEPSST